MWLEMGSLFRGLSSDPTIRAIVLSGAHPSAFTTGLDTTGLTSNPLFTNTSFPSASNASPIDTNSTTTSTSSLDVKSSSPESPFPDPARRSQALRDHISTFQASLTSVATCNKPVIAAIHGYCLGLGVDLSLCADVRICSADTTFSVKEVDIGLAADVGTLSRLPKVVGGGHGSWVYDVCLSGRYFRAEEAAKVGFVSRVVEGGNDGRGGVAREGVVDEALKWAALVAEKSPVAVAGTKEILRWSWDKSVEDGKYLSLTLFPIIEPAE